MSLARKLQIKDGQTIAVLRRPDGLDLDLDPAEVVDQPGPTGAALVFVRSRADIERPEVETVLAAARHDRLAWVAYPKAGKLGTDINRDSLATLLSQRGVRPVRQIALDDTWSALRFRPAA